MNAKKDFDAELMRKNQEINDLNAAVSSFKILESHLNKKYNELKEENLHLKEEYDKLRKTSLDVESQIIKKLQDEIEESKTLNQLYRSQRYESDEEIKNLTMECDKLKSDLLNIKKELFVFSSYFLISTKKHYLIFLHF